MSRAGCWRIISSPIQAALGADLGLASGQRRRRRPNVHDDDDDDGSRSAHLLSGVNFNLAHKLAERLEGSSALGGGRRGAAARPLGGRPFVRSAAGFVSKPHNNKGAERRRSALDGVQVGRRAKVTPCERKLTFAETTHRRRINRLRFWQRDHLLRYLYWLSPGR